MLYFPAFFVMLVFVKHFTVPLSNSACLYEEWHSHPVSVSKGKQLRKPALENSHQAGQLGEGAEALSLPPWPHLQYSTKQDHHCEQPDYRYCEYSHEVALMHLQYYVFVFFLKSRCLLCVLIKTNCLIIWLEDKNGKDAELHLLHIFHLSSVNALAWK